MSLKTLFNNYIIPEGSSKSESWMVSSSLLSALKRGSWIEGTLDVALVGGGSTALFSFFSSLTVSVDPVASEIFSIVSSLVSTWHYFTIINWQFRVYLRNAEHGYPCSFTPAWTAKVFRIICRIIIGNNYSNIGHFIRWIVHNNYSFEIKKTNQ